MSKAKQPEKVPFLIATQRAVEAVNGMLDQLKQPMNQAPETQSKIKSDLRKLLKEILVITQQTLLLNNTGKASGVKADVIGWTTAETDYDNDDVVANLPHAPIVNKILKELISEQEQVALSKGVAVSETQILKAQTDSLDKNKDTITLETLPDPELNNARSKVEIDKATGDTQLYVQDPETGLWSKVGTKMKGYWQNTKDFCKNIWNWIVEKFVRAKEWICSLFKSPDDADVIYEQVPVAA